MLLSDWVVDCYFMSPVWRSSHNRPTWIKAVPSSCSATRLFIEHATPGCEYHPGHGSEGNQLLSRLFLVWHRLGDETRPWDREQRTQPAALYNGHIIWKANESHNILFQFGVLICKRLVCPRDLSFKP